jgi:peptide/nickel transport system substrate-binding protein
VNRIPDQYFKLEANENYHGGKPYVKEIMLKVFTSKDPQILALKSGEVDIVSDISPPIADSLKGTENIEVYSIPDTRGYEVDFNVKNYPSNITTFRKAMAHAIDREKICSIVFGGYASPTYTTFLMPSVAHDFVNSDTPIYYYNLTETKRLLKSAGFNDSDGDSILEGPDGEDVTITIPVGATAAAAGSIDNKIAEVLKNDWEELGIEVNIKQVEFSQWFMEVHKNPVFIVGIPYLMHDDPDDLAHFGSMAFFRKPNWYDYNNPAFDQLIEQERSTADREERKQVGYEMQEILANDVQPFQFAVPIR